MKRRQRPTVLGGKLNKRDARGEVLAKHGLTEEKLKDVVKVSHRLAQVHGGHKACVEALRGDEEADSKKFIETFDTIPSSDRLRLSLEEIACIAGITSRRLVELVMGALITQGEEDTKLIVASNKPKIIARMAKLAQGALNEKDRENFLKGKDVDWFPASKGIAVNVDNRTQNNTLNTSDNERSLPPPKADTFLLELASTLRHNVAQLEAPEPVVHANIPEIDGEYADV